MHEELSGPMQVELLAAALTINTLDYQILMDTLAAKLKGSLPNQTIVKYQNRLFSQNHPVLEIIVALGDYQYRINLVRKGVLVACREKIVRGIVLKTDQISMDQWINELAQLLGSEAANSVQTRTALEQFLL